MGRLADVCVGIVLLSGCGGTHGVHLTVPPGWERIQPASDGPVTDPRTLLVVGTAGVHAYAARCQIAAYRVPASGAVVVVVGWKNAALSSSTATRVVLTRVQRPIFECFPGRGAAADVLLGGREYQVNVMVGDRAPKRLVEQALAVGRSLRAGTAP